VLQDEQQGGALPHEPQGFISRRSLEAGFRIQGLGFWVNGLGRCLRHATVPTKGEQRCLDGGLALAAEAATRQGRQARLTRTHGIVI
jgi:hypothetical protein